MSSMKAKSLSLARWQQQLERLRRQLAQGAIVINGERATHDERMDFPVFSLVFFPKSDKRRTTLV